MPTEKFDSNVFRNEYLKWVNSKMELSDINNGVVRIDTPFVDNLSDQMVMYALQKSDGTILLTDDGWTIDNLESSGVTISRSKKRRDILNNQLKLFGVSNDDDSLTIKTGIDELPEKKHQLIQAMLFVNDMFMLAPKNTSSIFVEDMTAFLDKNEIRYMKNANYTGKSGLMNMFEYSIAGDHKNIHNKLIKTLASPNNKMFAQSIVTAIGETRPETEDDTDFYVFIQDYKNDTQVNINEGIINLLRNNDIKPVPFSDRDDYVKELSE